MSILNRLRKTDEKKTAGTATKTSEKKSETAVAKTASTGSINNAVLLHPIVTEKATVNGTYMFEVPLSANKSEVSKAVERIYGEKPAHVRMMRVEGKTIRTNYGMGKRKDWKKAIVRLPKGKTITIHEGV